MAKSTYVLIPGAGSGPWYWHRARPLLEERGHEVVTPDLPVEDDSAGLEAYVAEIERAVGDREDVVVVGQSMGGLAATVFASRRPVRRLVLLAPMIPAPGETGGDYWHNTGQPEAARELAEREGRDPDSFDPFEIFLHDVPEEVAHASGDHARDQIRSALRRPGSDFGVAAGGDPGHRLSPRPLVPSRVHERRQPRATRNRTRHHRHRARARPSRPAGLGRSAGELRPPVSGASLPCIR